MSGAQHWSQAGERREPVDGAFDVEHVRAIPIQSKAPSSCLAVTTTKWLRAFTTATLTGRSRAQRSFQPAPVAAYSSARACSSAFRSSVGSSRS
jgi:hypothetical protein